MEYVFKHMCEPHHSILFLFLTYWPVCRNVSRTEPSTTNDKSNLTSRMQKGYAECRTCLVPATPSATNI